MNAAEPAPSFEAWREKARALLANDVPPAQATFELGTAQPSLFASAEPARLAPATTARVPRQFVEVAEIVACHRSEDRWQLLYRVLYRLTHGEPELLEVLADPDTLDLLRRKAAVLRDVHKTHAFVRFRQVREPAEGAPDMVAWHEPAHLSLRLAAPFFARRFPGMRWAILTPDASVHWTLSELVFGPGRRRSDAPQHDDLEQLFAEYWRAITNPARINLAAMQREMPRRHWATIPETALIPELVAQSAGRVQVMRAPPPSHATASVAGAKTLPELRERAAGCTACPLYEPATQTVFGEGPPHARIMLVGEQPGDREDQLGRPFVGPAGQLLDAILIDAGIARTSAYLTNAVKHFKFEPRGKRRIHSKPSYGEVMSCRGWLDAEIEALRPEVIVCLGATAAQSFMGRKFALSRSRGTLEKTRFAPHWLATWHPSALLRANDAGRAKMHEEMVADLRLAHGALGNGQLA